jgi:hypothetical protein
LIPKPLNHCGALFACYHLVITVFQSEQ